MEQKIRKLIAELENAHDFNDEFYQTYIGNWNDGDISEWHNNHFDDNVALGESVGMTILAADIINQLKHIIGE